LFEHEAPASIGYIHTNSINDLSLNFTKIPISAAKGSRRKTALIFTH